jgi:putative ABC transport system substrate-binding protein
MVGILWCLGANEIALAAPRAAIRTVPRVAVVRSSTAVPMEEASRAISEALQRQQPRFEVMSYLLPAAGPLVRETFAQIRQARPDAVLTLGSRATAAALAEGTDDLPVVFSMVLHPGQAGFLRSDVTGVSLDVGADEQFRLLRRLLPRARTVGVLYDPDETGVVVAEARRSAARMGFELATEVVSGPSEALRAVERLARRVDVLWAVPDSNVFTPLTTGPIQLAALQRRVPVLGMSASHARTGALAAVTVDYRDVGRQTAELVRRVVRQGSANRIPVARPRKTGVIVNVRTARRLGIPLDPAVTRQATEVVR